MYNSLMPVIAIKTVQWDAFNPAHECCRGVIGGKFYKLGDRGDGGRIWMSIACDQCGKSWHVVKGGPKPADKPQHVFLKELESKRDVPLGWTIVD